MHQFDSGKTERFFNDHFPGAEKKFIPGSTLHFRDEIFVKHLLPHLGLAAQKNARILDFGCGRGDLLVHLIESGYDVIGMDKYAGMRTFAEASADKLNARDRIVAGGVDELGDLPDRSFDLIVMMGVLQYLPDVDYQEALKQVPRLLRPRGALVATFQNAFFDLFTFNKYTLDFLMNGLLGPSLQDSEREKVEHALSGLMSSPDMPLYSPTRARDNVFVRLTNPITIGDELRGCGLSLVTKYFYEWFGLPPLLSGSCGDISARIAGEFEIERATSWQGHFMANAFLTHIAPLTQVSTSEPTL
jgi:ubiquinone/menaquinone biosynthesis C-methylase UbiE